MTKPLWIDPEGRSFPALERDLEVDVAIIGAGFSGLGAAWALRDEGISSALLEARTLAGGASGRNAGFVLAGPAMGFADSVRAVGLDETRAIWDLTRRNHRMLAEIIEELDIECGYLRRGSMSLAASEEEWQERLLDLSGMEAAGIAVCSVERESLPAPFDRMYRGGIYFAGNGEMDPGNFLRAVARHLFSSIGIFERTRVESIEASGGWKLRTPNGTVSATRVVVATNAYTSSLLSVPIAPTRGQVLASEPLDTVLVPFPMYANRGFQYWRQTPGGRLVVGGWRDLAIEHEIGIDEELNPDIHQALDRFIAALHSGNPPRVSHRWSGIMGFTPDHMPLVGPVPGMNGVFMAAGYSGHGVAMAFLSGAFAANLAAGRSTKIPSVFSPARFV